MRIGTQNLLLIVPLFLGVAVALGLLLYFSEPHELLWGQEQQASSYAIAIAEFASERETNLHPSVYSPSTDDGLRRALDRILSSHRVKAVFQLSPNCKTIAWSYPAGAVKTVPFATPGNLATLMSHDGVWTSDVLPTKPRGAVVQAYSSMQTPTGTPLGAIGVITDASSYLRETRQTQTGVALAAIGVLIVGLLVSIFVSSLISREVRSLSETAALIAGGNLDVQAPGGRIQEIEDLGGTFNTMSDVLKDVLSRTKRSLVEGEQLRTPAEMAESYIEMFRPPIAATMHGVRICSRAIGEGSGMFWTAVETASGSCAALGRLTAEDEVATAIAASAAARYLTRRLIDDDPKQALTEAMQLFHADSLECLRFTGDKVEHWDAVSGQPTVQSYPAASRSRWALHRVTPDAGSIVDRYLSLFDGHAPDDLAGDIAAAMPADSDGAILIAGTADAD